MAFFLSPVLNEQQFDASGDPRAGGLITAYLAGTLTAVTVYKTSTGTAHSSPITLDSSGNYPNGTQLWLQGGFAYKFVITDSTGANSRTYDNITGVGDDLSGIDQWVVFSSTATYISATSFSVVGDQTGTFQIARRLRTVNGGGTIYSTISNSVFAAGITTVTVTNDSGVLDASLSQVSYGLLSATNPSIPFATATEYRTGTNPAIGVSVKVARDNNIVAGTPVATTSGTSIDITGIPAWVKRITVMFSGVSTNGTSFPQILLGDSGGPEASGYLGSIVSTNSGGSSGVDLLSSGFTLNRGGAATNVMHGSLVLALFDPATNTWSANGNTSNSEVAFANSISGTKALSAALDRIRLTTQGGVNTFDAGSVNILYE